MFSRPNGNRSQYYFEAIQVAVQTNGTYTFVTDSTIDTYGCLYNDQFDPTNSSSNLVRTDNDSGQGKNFSFTVNLTAAQSLILVVTTYTPLQKARFNVTVYGSAHVTLKGTCR